MDGHGLLPIKHYIVGLHGFSIAMFQYQSVCSYFYRKKKNTGKSTNIIFLHPKHYIHILFYLICLLLIYCLNRIL